MFGEKAKYDKSGKKFDKFVKWWYVYFRISIIDIRFMFWEVYQL